MSMESELETLYVRIKVQADKVEAEAKAAARIIAKTVDTILLNVGVIVPTVDASIITKDLGQIKKQVEGTIRDINKFIADNAVVMQAQININPAAVGQLKELQELTRTVGFSRFAAQMASAARAMGTLAGGHSLAAFASQVKQAASQIDSIPTEAWAKLIKMANAISWAHKKLEFIGPITGIVTFANQMFDAAYLMSGSTFSATGFTSMVLGIDAAYTVLRQVRAVPGLGTFLRNLSYAYIILSKINATALRGFFDFVLGLSQADQILRNVGKTSNLQTFVTNLQNAANATAKIGAMPELKTMATNANTAAAAMKALNTQLAWYVIHMNNIAKQSGTIASTNAVARAQDARGVTTPGGRSTFGFDPLRRSLSVMTSIATGMAVGFVSYEVMHQIAAFDEQVTRAMASAHIHMQEGLDMPGVRRTVEAGIMDLARRVATPINQLAEAFNELTLAGYGTENAMQALAIVEKFAFVGGMEAGKAAKELAVLQRQLGLVSNDTADNMKNLQRMTDSIASGMLISGLSAEHFLKGLKRLSPHMLFMNRGLEDGVALLTAFGRIDSATAVSRAEALVRGISQQFARSEMQPGSIHAGAPASHDPLGTHGRGFRPGQGVHPIHELQDHVRLATQAYRNMGVTDPTNLMQTIQQIDAHTRNMTATMRQAKIVTLSLHPNAQEALIALLEDTEAMEQFYLAAKRADGILAQVANDRLGSFNSQLAILKNNLVVVGIQVGQFLAPAFVLLNQVIIAGFDAWNDLGRAGRETVMVIGSMLLGLTALRFLVPVAIGLLKVLFWDTAIGAARAVWWTISTVAVIGYTAALIVAKTIMGFITVVTLAWKAAVWLLNISLATTLTLLGGVILVVAVFAGWVIAAAFAIQTIVSLVVQLASYANANRGGLASMWEGFVEGAVHAFWVTAGFIENFRHNMQVLMGWLDTNWGAIIFNITNFATVAFSNLWTNIKIGFMNMLKDMVRTLIDFLAATVAANLNPVEGLRRLGNLIGARGPLFGPQQQQVPLDQDLRNETPAHAARRRQLEGFVQRAQAQLERVVAGQDGVVLMADARAAQERLQQRQDELAAFNRPALLTLTRLLTAPAGIEGALAGPGGAVFGSLVHGIMANVLRTDLSPENRTMIGNMMGGARGTPQANEVTDAANRIGDTFKEISLNRFVLDGVGSEQREEFRQMEENNRLLGLIYERLGGAPVGAVAVIGPMLTQ